MQQLTTNENRGGGRVASDALRQSLDLSLDLTGLDQTIDRYQLLLLVKRVGKQASFTPRMIQLLDYYMAYTTAADWEEGSRPIVFQSLARTAMDLGVGERQIQKLEKRLFDLGAITWNDSGNHKRFGRRDAKSGRLVFAYGVDLTPLAYLKPELEAKLHEKQLYAEAWRATKREISERRRQIRGLLMKWQEEGADPKHLAEFETAYREIAIELRSHIDLTRMRSILKQHEALTNTLMAKMGVGATDQNKQPTTSLPIAPTTVKSSCRHAQKVAHQEQTTPDKKRGTSSQHKGAEQRRPFVANNLAVGNKSEPDLGLYACERLQHYLPLSSGGLTTSDLIEAASSLRRDLGISQASWADACGCLGRHGAALGVLLTDRAVQRSSSRIERPAAYFRAIVRDKQYQARSVLAE